MKKKFNFRTLAILCLAFGLVVSLTRCKKYDDDVNSLQTQISALKSDVKKDFNDKVDVQIANLKTQLDANVAKLKELESSGANSTDVESKIAAVKQELMNTLVSLETFNAFKTMIEGQIENAATKDEVARVTTDINSLEGRVAALEGASNVASGNSQALEDFKAQYATEYQALKDDISALSAKIASNSNAIQGLRDLIKSKVDQSTLDALKEKLNKSLGNKADQSKLDKLNTDLRALITALQTGKADKSDFDALKTKVDDFLAKDLDVNIAALSGRLSGLILVPDYVADRAGALPVLNFSPVKTSCGYKDPEVLVRYMVNPSNASLDQIDVNNIKFYYNDPMVAAKSNKDGVGQMAKFVSLENGVLTVKAIVESEKLWASKNNNNEGRIDQLMLQVPLKDGNVINSDWVKVTSRKTSALIAKKLTRKGEEVTKRDIPEYVLKNTVPEAKNIDVDNNTENYTVVDLVYNEELDLSEVFKALYNNYTSLDTQAYGFKFKFDFNNEDGQPISYIVDANNYYGGGVTKTDQQEFIEFVPGSKTKVRARLFDENGNNLRAAIGRTPILHVSLVKSDDENCVVKNGFVKLNIVDKYVAPKVIEKVYTSEITAGCFDGGAAVVDLVGTEAMNKDFYQAVPMSRTEFIQNYYLTYGIPGETNENQIGYVRGYAIDPSLEKAPISTTNLAYVIPNNVVTDKEYYGKTVSRTFYFVRYNNSNDYFKVTFKVTIKAPETVEVNRFNEYWKDSYATQNVAVPNPAGTNDASKCTWDNNINAVFANKDKNLALPEGYNYEYVFTKDQFVVDGVELKASSNGKELRASGELVAIIKDHTDFDNNEGDILSYNETSEVAKKLLNSGRDAMRARLAIKVTNSCGMPISVNIEGLNSNQFVLRFLRPINFSNISTGSFQDGVGFGQEGSYLNVLDVVKLTDWRGRKFSAYKNFYGYYGVSSIVLDKSHVTLKNGQPLPSTIELNQVFDQQVSPDTPYYGKLTYKNNGSYLQSDLVLVVPVTVTYKWGKIVSENVEITVKKTSDVSSN